MSSGHLVSEVAAPLASCFRGFGHVKVSDYSGSSGFRVLGVGLPFSRADYKTHENLYNFIMLEKN